MKWLKGFIGILILTLGHVQWVSAKSAIVFVHGRGAESFENIIDYWSPDMIQSVTDQYRIPSLVLRYDSRQHMTRAAITFAQQVTRFLEEQKTVRPDGSVEEIDSLFLVSHSFGGIVGRWVLSNPQLDPNFALVASKVKRVYAIACPCAGSKVADVGHSLRGYTLSRWVLQLMGEDTDSAWNLRTDAMAYWNEYFLKGTEGRPALPVDFYSISGTESTNDWWHLKDYKLALVEWLVGFEEQNDGIVSVRSSESAGQPYKRTDANHFHNARNDFRPLGKLIMKDIKKYISETY